MCRVQREMLTPGPPSLTRLLPGTRDLRISCLHSEYQVHFHPPEGRMHLPKPKEGCLQRLWVALECESWAVHTHMHNTWHGVGWDQEGNSREAGWASLSIHHGTAQISWRQNSKFKPGLSGRFSREDRICFI